MNMCLILNDYRGRTTKSHRPNFVRFLFVGSDEGRTLQIKRLIHKTNCLLAVLDAAAHVKKREYERTTRGLRASCKVRCGWRRYFRIFWGAVTDLLFMCNKFVI